MDLIITILPVVIKDLPISPRFTLTIFVSRCKFSNLTTRQPVVELYLLAFPRFSLRKKKHKSYFAKNPTRDFRTCRWVGYLLLIDHSGDNCYNPHVSTLQDRQLSQNSQGTVVVVVVVAFTSKTILTSIRYLLFLTVLSTCPLHTNSGCGKERRDLPRQHSFETTLRFTGPEPADSRQ